MRPDPHVEYLALPEDLTVRYNLPQYPTCRVPGSSSRKTMEEIASLIQLLPPAMQKQLLSHERRSELIEVVMDLGRTPLARFPSGDVEVSSKHITRKDLDYAVQQLGAFGSDNRAGIDATLHRISCMRNRAGDIIGLTCRVGRAVPGSAAMVTDLVLSGSSILLLGRPGMGKTTAIREISRLLADAIGKRVVICDTSNEIGGDGDVPHPGIGRARRMQVGAHDRQHEVMIEAVENHMPQVVVIDEIGTEAETQAARTISQRGVQLVATAHGNELENLIKNPSLVDLVGGVGSVTLGDEEARRRGVQKSVLERLGPPTFDVCVEMLSRREWAVWEDVGIAVDLMLLGREPPRQVRSIAEDGRVIISNARGAPRSGRRDGSGRRAGEPAAHQASSRIDVADSSATVRYDEDENTGVRDSGVAMRVPDTPVDPFAGWDDDGLSAAAAPAYDPVLFRLDEERKSSGAPDKVLGGASGAAPQKLRVFTYGLDSTVLMQSAETMRAHVRVKVVDAVHDADLVIATREKMRVGAGRKMREQARSRGTVVLTVKNGSIGQCTAALRAVSGIDPSPGDMLGRPWASPLTGPVDSARCK